MLELDPKPAVLLPAGPPRLERCKRGHELNVENRSRSGRGTRCRLCEAERARARYRQGDGAARKRGQLERARARAIVEAQTADAQARARDRLRDRLPDVNPTTGGPTMEATKISGDRDVYEVDYSGHPGADELDGEAIEARFENPDNGDVSVYRGANDGKFVVTVARDWTGSDKVTIEGSDGGEISGEVTFGG